MTATFGFKIGVEEFIALYVRQRNSVIFLIADIPLCFNSQIKTNSLLGQKTTTLCIYWYCVVAACFGLSLDHLQAYVLK
jgi:hypothetical protein